MLSAASLREYLPPTHCVHSADPTVGLYLPATHFVQDPPYGPVNPALHMQSASSLLDTGEVESGGQKVHSLLSADEYLATGQSVQAATLAAAGSGENLPA